MGLRKKNSGYDYNGDWQDSSIMNIVNAQKRMEEKKKILDDIQYEYNLIKADTFRIYKSEINYDWFLGNDNIAKAKEWIHMRSSKIDKRKKYEEKEIYEFITYRIEDTLGINGIDIVSFIDYNFGEATEIEFEYNNNTWRLCIPNVSNIKLKSFEIYGSGVFRIKIMRKTSGYSWGFVGDSYDESCLKEIMQDYEQRIKEEKANQTSK